MSHRLGARVLTAALLATATLGVPTAAHAERSVTQDASRDAVRFVDVSEDAETPVTAPAPWFTTVDIIRSVVDHRADRLRLSVRYRDLKRTPFHSTMFRVATPKRSFWLSVDRGFGTRAGEAHLSGPGMRDRECRGLRWSINFDTDRVTASVPTTCIGSPRWVKLGVGAIGAGSGSLQDPDDIRMFADDGHSEVAIGDHLTMGPKVSRG